MEKIKVVVVGNCQARPLAQYLMILNDRIEVSSVLIVHLLKNEDYSEYKRYLEKADVIISQLVFDTYPCDFVKTSFLRARYSNKVVSILNLFFLGYFPDYTYLRHPLKGMLGGPLLDYHSKIILKNWVSGNPLHDAVMDLVEGLYYEEQYPTAIQDSIDELREREALVDVGMCDFIEDRYAQERLFFTFNHPSKNVLIEYAKRVLTFIDMEFSINFNSDKYAEPLGSVVILGNPIYEINFRRSLYVGFEVMNITDWNSKKGNRVEYNAKKLVESFYLLYDLNRNELIDFINSKGNYFLE